MSDADQSGAGRREVAYRLFAAEFDDADLSYSESDEERAPNYVVTPTGARVNRLFAVGVLTEVEAVSDEVLRGRVVDPTGAFVLYAGQYQPDERAFLDGADTPTFVAVTGKARTFQPEDSDRVFTSVRPETVSEVDAATRDRWTVQTAEQTIERVGHAATALALGERGEQLQDALAERGVDEGLASGIALALDHYGTTPAYLAAVRGMATDAARVVAGELDEVDPVSVPPDAAGDADLDALAATSVTERPVGESTADAGEGAHAEEGPQASASAGPEPSGTDAGEPSAGAETTAAGSETGGGTTGADATAVEADDGDDIGDFEPGEFELDEEEREEIEEEYGTEFQSGTEVDDPGEADIETPDPEDVAPTDQPDAEADAAGGTTGRVDTADADEATSADAEGPETPSPESTATEPTTDEETGAEADTETGAETGTDEGTGPDEEGPTEPEAGEQAVDPEEVDLADAVVDAMEELDEGSGADREAVVEAVVERYGASPAAVEDAIQDALMDGQCYEPDDATLKAI